MTSIDHDISWPWQTLTMTMSFLDYDLPWTCGFFTMAYLDHNLNWPGNELPWPWPSLTMNFLDHDCPWPWTLSPYLGWPPREWSALRRLGSWAWGSSRPASAPGKKSRHPFMGHPVPICRNFSQIVKRLGEEKFMKHIIGKGTHLPALLLCYNF